jgi:hypothetical protein
MTLLDWEKAFDKVDHQKLLEALERLDIHEHIMKALKDGYEKATFFTKDEFGQSEKKTQSPGIRQGCPLPTITIPIRNGHDLYGRRRQRNNLK